MTKNFNRVTFMARIEKNGTIIESTESYILWKDNKCIKKTFFKDGEFTCHRTVAKL